MLISINHLRQKWLPVRMGIRWRVRCISATKQFQRKPHKFFLSSMFVEYVTLIFRRTDIPEVRCGLTDRHTDNPTTVTLTVHVRRGCMWHMTIGGIWRKNDMDKGGPWGAMYTASGSGQMEKCSSKHSYLRESASMVLFVGHYSSLVVPSSRSSSRSSKNVTFIKYTSTSYV